MQDPKKFHFLVVDDDIDSRQMVVEYLEASGVTQITAVSDGRKATEALKNDPTINFIISDWDMPHVNGLSLLQFVKSNPKYVDIPFLIITNPISQEVEKVILAAENMVDSYLIKPFRKSVLVDKIDTILCEHEPEKQKIALVVDDDNDSREMILEYLDNMGFKNRVSFDNGEDALDFILQNKNQLTLIIADWEMPRVTGIEILRACKSDPDLSTIPFLMVTSQSSMERLKIMQAARSKVDQYLLKPFRQGDIESRVQKLVAKNRHRKEITDLIEKGNTQYDQGKYAESKGFYEKVLNLDAENHIALSGIGNCVRAIDGSEAAMPFYKRAIEINPYDPGTYLKLSSAYEKLGWNEKAIDLLRAGISQISFSAELHFELGNLYHKIGEISAAQNEFEKTLEIELHHKQAAVMLAMIKNAKS